LLVVAGGKLMLSEDGGQRWRERPIGSGDAAVETGAFDPISPDRIWSTAHGHIYVSDDLGFAWRTLAGGLPQSGILARGLAADETATKLVVATAAGVFRSEDGGRSWQVKQDNLPAHLEAGALIRDPTDPKTLYTVYSLVPYTEIWRGAIEGRSLLSRIDMVSLVGGIAFFLLVVILCTLLVIFLVRQRSARTSPSGSLP
jgi:hypothetical protein